MSVCANRYACIRPTLAGIIFDSAPCYLEPGMLEDVGLAVEHEFPAWQRPFVRAIAHSLAADGLGTALYKIFLSRNPALFWSVTSW